MDLDTVVEDDISDSASIEVTSKSDWRTLILAKHSEDLASALYVADDNNTQPVNGTDSQDNKVFDISNVSLSNSEGEDNIAPLPVASQRQKPRSGLKPVVPNTQPVKTLKRKAVPQPATLAYDRDACIFDIECVVRQQDGTNSPFRISSVISLDNLHTLIAEKIEHFPTHVHLRYCLDVDKAKAGVILIQTDGELKMFKDYMRDLLVPPVLANGKKSSHIMKKVHVIFEDASMDQQSSNPGGNKDATATQGGKQTSSLANTEADTKMKSLIKDLQQRWKSSATQSLTAT
ncbi:hypothetical protein OG21DRAFT_1492043 [Imleria badia]|nr:hypothetical protein OG21DRAFT_1492043 [Imleria badia]